LLAKVNRPLVYLSIERRGMRMRQNQPVTEKLAKWAAATSWEALPSEVAHQAKRSLMNFFAVALTGCRDATIETTLASLGTFSAGGQAAVIGRSERLDALSAAFINAAGANVLDFCDTHVPTAIHPTAPIVPALLAAAELQPVRGRDLLLALVLGQEIACRIGLAMSPSHYNKGWHITATCGVFGAAAGSGKLLGLGTEQMIWALGLAATQAAGLCECLGTPAKSVGVGNAARNGLWSALLAARNFAGPAEPLDGAQGYYHALGETPDLAQLTGGLGNTWEILKTSYKPYPCGFVVHPVLDCVLDWRRDHQAAVIEKVAVTGNPLMVARADRPDISTGRESQVSVQHAIAAALLTGKAGLEQFTDACVQDPRAQALRHKVSVAGDAGIATTAAAVAITTAGGEVHTLTQHAARGSDANPMSDRDLEDKLRDAAAGWNPRCDIVPLIEAIWRVDENADVSRLAAITVPRL
jgi:2-methylcitrate dehydratase PrpD